MYNMFGEDKKNLEVQYIVTFDNEAEANEWLSTEESDFRERELLTEDEVIEQYGDYYRQFIDDGSHPSDWANYSISDFTPSYPDGLR